MAEGAAPIDPGGSAGSGTATSVDRVALARAIREAAYLEGDFVLSSGARSRYYLDKYLFETRPEILRPLAVALAGLVPEGVDRIVGTELGAVALATALSLETGLPFAIARKEPKGYSTARAIEGELRAGDRVIVVEDVITTGAQAIKAARTAADAGATVLRIVGVVDRGQDGVRNAAEAGFELVSLFSREDLGIA